MSIYKIIKEIDKLIEDTNSQFVFAVEVNAYLARKGLLKDDKHRPGKPLRDLLRKGSIPHAFQISRKWHIPHSRMKGNDSIPTAENKIENTNTNSRGRLDIKRSGNKLEPIKMLISELIENNSKIKPELYYEHKVDWMVSYPSIELVKNHSIISNVYSELVGNLFSLHERLALIEEKKLTQLQRFDIWVGKPFNFAIEFDEKQHFNQYRALTLKHYDNFETGFIVKQYNENCEGISMKPGKSGFQKLKSNDILFPELLDGELQDNRIRQRAFRDFLKDFLPMVNNANPTVRIPYHVTNKVIKDFSDKHISLIRNYLVTNSLILT